MPTNVTEPSISTAFALLLTCAFALSYLGSLYISKNTRLSFSSKTVPTKGGEARRKEQDERWRDDPDVIKARLASVSLASLGCCFAVSVVVYFAGGNKVTFGAALLETIQRLGLNLQLNPRSWSIYSHLLTPLLFFGPLYALFLGGSLPLQRRWSFRDNLMPFCTWMGLRNYILAPITEEIVFRACVLSVYHLSGASKTRMIFLSPLSFGAAHVHHAWETYNRYGRTPAAAKRAIIMSLFQFTYTTLFGFHCAFLFLRTGSIFPPISAHVFCNIMGVPQLGSELGRFPRYKIAIMGSYVLGILAFVYAYWPLTTVQDSIYWQNSNHPPAMH